MEALRKQAATATTASLPQRRGGDRSHGQRRKGKAAKGKAKGTEDRRKGGRQHR